MCTIPQFQLGVAKISMYQILANYWKHTLEELADSVPNSSKFKSELQELSNVNTTMKKIGSLSKGNFFELLKLHGFSAPKTLSTCNPLWLHRSLTCCKQTLFTYNPLGLYKSLICYKQSIGGWESLQFQKFKKAVRLTDLRRIYVGLD